MKTLSRLKPTHAILMFSLSIMLLLLTAAAGMATPSLPEVSQVEASASSKFRFEQPILASEQTSEPATQVEEQAGVSNVCAPAVEIPAFLSDSDEILPADESTESAELDLLLDESQIASLPQLLNSLQSYQAQGKVSEFKLVEPNRIRFFSDSSTIEALRSLPAVSEVIEAEGEGEDEDEDEEESHSERADSTLADEVLSQEAVADEERTSTSWDYENDFLEEGSQRGEEAAEATREYWLILEPTQREFLPTLSEALEKLKVQGLVLDFEAMREENNTLKVLATTKAYNQLQQLPIISAVALSAPPLSLSSRTSGGGAITGRVTALDGTPLEGIYLTVGYDFYQAGEWVWFHGGSTNAEGAYTINLSESGSYRLNFHDPDRVYLSEYYNNAMNFESATNIEVIAGESTTGIDAQLSEGGHITGKISNRNGNPIANIQVTIYGYDEQADEWEQVRVVYTNAEGVYDANGLDTGSYRVHFKDFEYKYRSEFYDDVLEIEDGSDVMVTLAQTTPNINASLEELGHITGKVSNRNGNPIANIQVTIYRYDEQADEWEEVRIVYTNAEGVYDANGLDTGSYRVHFKDWEYKYRSEFYDDVLEIEDGSDVMVTLAQTTPNINASLEELGHITGKVQNEAGTPLPYIKVTAYESNEEYYYWSTPPYDYTDAQGQYDIGGLDTGSYRVAFSDSAGNYLPQYYQNATNFDGAADVSVLLNQTTPNINAQLKKAGHIRGAVGEAISQLATNALPPTELIADYQIYLPFMAKTMSNPLANIEVSVYQYDEEQNKWLLKGEAHTNSYGSYEINGLDTGTYRLAFFDPLERYLPKYYQDGLELDRATDVEVVAGQITSRINQQLDEGGKITGLVKDASNNPVPNTSVYVYRYDDEEVYWEKGGERFTNFEGSYTIGGLQTADYRVCFANRSENYLSKCYGDVTDFYSTPKIAVTQGKTMSGIDVRLDKDESGEIHGTISNAEGQPLPYSYVFVLWHDEEEDSWYWVDLVSSNSNGQYQVKDLNNGTYRLLFYDEEGDYLFEYYNNVTEFASATDLSVTKGQILTNIDAQLRDAGSISGLIRGADGELLTTAVARAYRYNQNENQWESINYSYTNSAGAYTIKGLDTGNYRLYFRDCSKDNLPEYYQNAADIESASDVSVTAGQTTTGIDGELAKSGSITGVVRDTEGNPIKGIRVEAYQYNAEEQEWQWISSYYTASSGKYEIKGLNNGTYRLYFCAWVQNYISEFYDNATEIESATDVSVTAGQITAEIDAVLDEGGHLTGTVTNPNDEPLRWVKVYAYRYNSQTALWNLVGDDYTNRQGEYEIDDLQSGSYRVEFIDYQDTYLSEYYDNAPDIESATTITVTVNQTISDIDAQLALGGTIKGIVTDADGQPLRWVEVSAYQYDDEEDSWQVVSSDYSHLYGKYDITDLQTGNYRIGFSDRKHLTEYYDDVTDIDEALDLSVTVGETITDINASLDKAGRIIGQISNANGRKLYDIQVTAYQYDEEEEAWQAIHSVLTNEQGYYNLRPLDTGSYRLYFQDSWEYAAEYYDDVLDLESATDIPVIVEQTTADIDAQLHEGGRLTGVVSDANGNPLERINVRVLQANSESNQWEVLKVTQTWYDGRYNIGGLNSGDYRLSFYDERGNYITEYYNNVSDIELAQDISVTIGETIANLNASLDKAGYIHGSISNSDGYLVPDIQVSAYQYDKKSASWEVIRESISNNEGQYTIGGLNSGTYRLGFHDSQSNYVTEYYNGAENLENAGDITVSAGQSTTGIDAQLTKAAQISGKVTDVSGNALRATRVELYQYDSEKENWQIIGTDTSNPYGNYKIRGLTAGSYRIGFFDDDYVAQYYNGAATLESATEIELTEGERIEEINAILEAE